MPYASREYLVNAVQLFKCCETIDVDVITSFAVLERKRYSMQVKVKTKSSVYFLKSILNVFKSV